MNATKKPSYNVIQFQNEYKHISPCDLAEIMETLEDMEYLLTKVKEFKADF